MIAVALGGSEAPPPPLPLQMVDESTWLRGLMARVIGLGVRPEMPKDLGDGV